MHRSSIGVSTKAHKLGLTRPSRKWTDAERQYVLDNYAREDVHEIARRLKRTVSAVRVKCNLLGFVRYKHWSQEEVEYLRRWYVALRPQEIAAALQRPLVSIYSKAYLLRLTKPIPKKRWSQQDVDYLRKNIMTSRHEDIASHLGRTVWAVGRKASNLRLLKK